MEVLLIGVENPIHLSEAGGDTENVVEDEKVVKTRRCQSLLPLGTSTNMLSLSPSILAFNFILFKGNFFLAFWGKEIGYFEGWSRVQLFWGLLI